MNALLYYLMQSSFCLGTLFLVYWIFLRRDTFFQVNRLFLILAGILSLTIPLFPFHRLMQEPVSPLVILLNPVLITPGKVAETVASHMQWFEIAQVIYFTGMVIFLFRFLVQIFQLLLLVRRSTVKRAHGCNLVLVDRGYSPFSFFNMVFINERNIAPENLMAILAHEQMHIRQAHTLDLILAELLIIIQWFNPFAWLLNRELKNIHEYLADEGVIRQGVPAPDYQQLILNETIGIQVNNLTNNFNISQLKKRIIMITQKRSGNWAISKMMLALPVILGLGLLFSVSTYSFNFLQDKKKDEPKSTGVPVSSPGVQDNKGKNQKSAKDNQTDVYKVVDEQPSFPGGEKARITFLVDNIKYPAQAMKDNIQGKVFVSFDVETDGSLTNVSILRGIGGGCDEEAVRVIKLMPKWSPGKIKGVAVNTRFNLPIKFILDSGKKEKQKQEIYLAPVPTVVPEKGKK